MESLPYTKILVSGKRCSPVVPAAVHPSHWLLSASLSITNFLLRTTSGKCNFSTPFCLSKCERQAETTDKLISSFNLLISLLASHYSLASQIRPFYKSALITSHITGWNTLCHTIVFHSLVNSTV